MKKILFLLFLVVSFYKLKAQAVYQPYSFQFYQKLSGEIYNPNTRIHSSMKPFFIDDSLLRDKSSMLLSIGIDSTRKSWVSRKLFQEHLLDIQKEDYTVYADFLPDFQIGRDVSGKKNTYLNTRGYQVGGTIGKKFSFYTSGFENQGRFADYYRNYIDQNGIVPGQSYNRVGGKYGAGL
jgi:hypothetical protein